MSHSDILRQLIPFDIGDTHAIDITLEGLHLDRAETSAERLLLEMMPDTTIDYLPSWERVLGIAPAADATRSERLAEILFRLRSLGRLDRQYFIDIAATVGYQITITEQQPLMAGIAQANNAILSEDIIWTGR